MFCPDCGTQNPDGAIFCAGCGTKLAADQPAYKPPVQQPVYEAPTQPVYQQPAYQQPVYQQPVYQSAYWQYQQPAAVPGKGMGIAAMILGIISLVFFCLWYIAIPCALIGVILGGISSSQAKQAGMKNGPAVAGLVCSCIALALAVLFIVILVVGSVGMIGSDYTYY